MAAAGESAARERERVVQTSVRGLRKVWLHLVLARSAGLLVVSPLRKRMRERFKPNRPDSTQLVDFLSQPVLMPLGESHAWCTLPAA